MSTPINLNYNKGVVVPKTTHQYLVNDNENESEIEISLLHIQAIEALKCSHGNAAEFALSLDSEEPSKYNNFDDNVNKIYLKTLTKNELLKENQKLRELLKKTIPDLPHVPDSESIGKIRKYYNEVQSLNAQLKTITQEMLAIRAKHGDEIVSIIKKQEINTELKVQEEKDKAIKEISNLKNEIFQLKEIINREKMDAEKSIQVLS